MGARVLRSGRGETEDRDLQGQPEEEVREGTGGEEEAADWEDCCCQRWHGNYRSPIFRVCIIARPQGVYIQVFIIFMYVYNIIASCRADQVRKYGIIIFTPL